MTDVAGVRDLQGVGHCRSDEVKRVAPDVHIDDCLLDLRHVALDALAALTPHFVMGVLLDRRCVRAVGGVRTMTVETENVCGFP